MVLRGLFGGHHGSDHPVDAPAPTPQAVEPAVRDTESVRRISAELEALPMEQRRYVAGFAYVLARVAHADLEVSDVELGYMEQAVVQVGHLSQAQAVLVVEMARNMNELYGATDDYVVTRDFSTIASREQREDLLRTAFAVGAADDSITAAEVAELNEVGKELGFRSDEVDSLRNEFRDQLSSIQAMRAARGA
ncbi:MAG TPA: TerB family tellurite resistance protein [Candidatus Deferrimicrobium sp.]|nr:TerB family tellurite resistance protein [Candidatus Deferrimicrobium sp.]